MNGEPFGILVTFKLGKQQRKFNKLALNRLSGDRAVKTFHHRFTKSQSQTRAAGTLRKITVKHMFNHFTRCALSRVFELKDKVIFIFQCGDVNFTPPSRGDVIK